MPSLPHKPAGLLHTLSISPRPDFRARSGGRQAPSSSLQGTLAWVSAHPWGTQDGERARSTYGVSRPCRGEQALRAILAAHANSRWPYRIIRCRPHLTLPSAKAAGFSVHRAVLPVGRLTSSPRAFSVSVCPAATSLSPSASMFLLALRSLSW